MTARSGSASRSTALGSLTTALSPNLYVLLFGWSLIEGLGAVLVIPAIAALIAANYEGKDRAFAYGIIGGVAGAAIAVGPVIGGFVTTYFSWRYVFVGEVVIVIAILLVRKRMQAAPRPAAPAAARRRRRRALGRRPRPDRLRDPAEQQVGLGHADRRADDRRQRDHPARVLAGAVPDRRRRLPALVLRAVGGAARAARPRHAARARAAGHRGRCAPGSRR